MINRRTFVISGLAIPLGVGIGLSAHNAMGNRASIRVIGDEDGVITLADTGNERILIAFGTVSDFLWGQLPSLTTLGRSRVDVIVASYDSLFSMPREQRNTEILTLVMQRNSSLAPFSGNIQIITDRVELALGNNGFLTLKVEGASSEAASPGTVAELELAGTRTVIVSDETALPLVESTDVHVLIQPGDYIEGTLMNFHPAIVLGTSVRMDETKDSFRLLHATQPLTLTPVSGAISMVDD